MLLRGLVAGGRGGVEDSFQGPEMTMAPMAHDAFEALLSAQEGRSHPSQGYNPAYYLRCLTVIFCWAGFHQSFFCLGWDWGLGPTSSYANATCALAEAGRLAVSPMWEGGVVVSSVSHPSVRARGQLPDRGML